MKKEENKNGHYSIIQKDESGVLIFKWNEEQIKLKQILDLIDYRPLIGNKRAR